MRLFFVFVSLCLASSLAAEDYYLSHIVPIESSPCSNEERYSLKLSCDGNPETYTVLLDSTPDGTDETRVPPRGNAPVTGFIWFDLGKVCDVFGVEIAAPQNNYYAPKDLDVMIRTEDKNSEKTVLKNLVLPYYCCGAVRTFAIERTRTRYIGLRFHSTHDEGRLKWSLIQFGEIRFLGADAENAENLDLEKVKINGMTHSEALANQNFAANRTVTAFPMERLIQDWMRQDGLENFVSSEIRENYVQKCLARRAERLKNVSAHCRDYVFVKHCQLVNQPCFASSAFLSDSVYKDRLGDWRMGSELYRLRLNDDGTVEIRPLLQKPGGIIRDPSVSYDGKMLVFSMRESESDDYHLYTMRLDAEPASDAEPTSDAESQTSADLKEKQIPVQITFEAGTADLEPVWLPDDDILFTSTRCDICVPCWSSDVTNIYRCSAQGEGLRRLTFDHAHNVKPCVLNDGRIVYTRWEYNDRNSAPIHKLFMMNDDGTTQTEFYGNNSIAPWSLIHPAPIPGSSDILVVGSGHHTDQAGRLMRLDRTRGTQENEGLEYVSPVEKFVPESIDFFAHDRKQSLYQFPYALDRTNWLVSICPEGNGPREFYPFPYGIYWTNEAGERELLVYDPSISSGQIVPVLPREKPMTRAGNYDLTQDSGFFYVQNIYYGPGLHGVPKGTIQKIRVVSLDNRAMSAGVGYHQPTAQVHTPVSVGNGSWDVKHVLGTVRVESDGSAFFKVPPRTAVYFQMLDEKGQMVQTMRSWAMVMPGETFGCIGCHENKRDTFIDRRPTTEALKHPPQEIQPLYGPGEIEKPEFWKTLTESERRGMVYLGPNAPQRMDVPQGFSYLRDIQPVWDVHCVKCHCDETKTPLNLLGNTSPYTWKESYEGLCPGVSVPSRPYVNLGKDTNTGREFAHSYLQLTNWGRIITKEGTPIHPLANAESRRIAAETHLNPNPGEGCTYVKWLPMGDSLPPMIPADFWGARHSRLMNYLEPTHYGLQLTEHEKDLVKTWIDLCVPYCGSYMEANTWDRMTHTYIHFYRDECRPAYLFQEAKRLRHAEIEAANLDILLGKKNVQIPEPLGGMEAQKEFIEAYENLPKTVPVRENEGGNLALNPDAAVFSLTSFPWAQSNSHWKYRYEFAPTNVLDGNAGTYWKPNLRTDLWLKISLGKERIVHKAVLTLHLEPGQEKTWNSAVLEFSNGERVPITLRCTSEPQEFLFPAQSCEWVKLTDLQEAFPLSASGVAEFELY